jgi:hypothetical protein
MRWHVIERLVKSEGWTHGVELGVFEGDTFKHLLASCPGLRLAGVDLFDSDFFESTREGRPPRAFNLEKSYRDLCRWCVDHAPLRGELLRMTTTYAAGAFKDATCDFVFIDADHRYEAICKDIDIWLPKIRDGGMMIGHDYNVRDFPGVVQAVTERFGSSVKLYEDHVWTVRC